MQNAPYASVSLLRESGVGVTADEICKNIIGRIDQISSDGWVENRWEEIPQVQITAAHVDLSYDPVQFPEGFVRVDAKKIIEE
ncbi:MAG: hypothetical protein AUF65_01345 [Chloroflexi bacterium 13_1_20CM_50_12]|nr:MAG: hypothetical protein AUF65_01345 [Chloroflexi bacterium 13_1_20CM_50_12]